MFNIRVQEEWLTENGKYRCPHCEKEYSKKGICSHIMRAHTNEGNFQNSGTTGKTWTMPKDYVPYPLQKCESMFGGIKTFQVHCNTCDIVFSIEERENKFPMKDRYWCSRSCANTHIISDDQKKAISIKLKSLVTSTKIYFCKNCKCCKKVSNKGRIFCSVKCRQEYAVKEYTDFKLYQSRTRFKFSLNSFPNKFDFSLIETYGWYKAKNHGDNLYGVSRDHIVSVRYGFDNNIPIWIISHPANCCLKPHSENASKGTKCDITIDELLLKIKNW